MRLAALFMVLIGPCVSGAEPGFILLPTPRWCNNVLDPYQRVRDQIQINAKGNGYPVAKVMLNGIWVPVVMIDTSVPIDPMAFEKVSQGTFSIGQELHPGKETDHGYARLYFSFFSALANGAKDLSIDLFRPSDHHSGIRKNLGQGYRYASHLEEIKVDKKKPRKLVEIAFYLEPEKMFWVEAWQAIKIADLIRIPSINIRLDDPYNKRPYILPSFCEEHCHNGRIAGKIPQQIEALERRLVEKFQAPDLFNEKNYRDIYKDLLNILSHAPIQAYKNDFFLVTVKNNYPLFFSEIQNKIRDKSEENVKWAINDLVALHVARFLNIVTSDFKIQEDRKIPYGATNPVGVLLFSNQSEDTRDFNDRTLEFQSSATGNGFKFKYFEYE